MPKKLEPSAIFRTEATKKQYLNAVLRRVRQVAERDGTTCAEVSPSMLIEDFLERSQDLRAASIRYHRAALSDWIRQHVAAESGQQKYLQRLKQTRRKLVGNAEPPDQEKYTRSISAKDWKTIKSYLAGLPAGWPRTAGAMLEATLCTGLRPNEWEEARLISLSPSDLEEIGLPWLVEQPTQKPAHQTQHKAIPYLFVVKGKPPVQGHNSSLRLIKVPLEATHPTHLLLDQIRMSRDAGKSFGIWLKEAQRGCRLLMKAIFPRRSWHYTLYSARYTYCKAFEPKRSRSALAKSPCSNVGTSPAKLETADFNPCKDFLFLSFPPEKREFITGFLDSKTDWPRHGKTEASRSKRGSRR